MNNPFYYQADERCKEATQVVLEEIKKHPEWYEEVKGGKTFGVMVVASPPALPSREGAAGAENGDTKALYAYSGQLLGSYDWEGFVPAVFDYLEPDGYFKQHEAEIVEINKKIDAIASSQELSKAREALYKAEQEKPVLPPSRAENFKANDIDAGYKESEAADDKTNEAYQAYIRERQHEKGEYRRQKAAWNERVAQCRTAVQMLQDEITALKHKRKEMSDDLQRWLFDHFEMLNARGEKKNLTDIFAEWAERTGSKCTIPPSGSGECCAPKLLQYAYTNGLKPLAIAEFCVDIEKTADGIRILGVNYREACQSRCKPILDWMLQGLEVDDNPLETEETRTTLDILYEDNEMIVVDKPAGMLSVPGKSGRKSAWDILREMRPECSELKMAHRLDMQTSGVLIAAKTSKSYKRLQEMFAEHESKSDETTETEHSFEKSREKSIRKTYYALLEGELPMAPGTKGIINLPLSADYLNRPRQTVDHEKGKTAITEYEVVGTVHSNDAGDSKQHTMLRLHPITGRTHQLRVHCASKEGLGMPILGDDLYGHHASRLYLHAQSIIIGEKEICSKQLRLSESSLHKDIRQI